MSIQSYAHICKHLPGPYYRDFVVDYTSAVRNWHSRFTGLTHNYSLFGTTNSRGPLASRDNHNVYRVGNSIIYAIH